MRCLTCFAGNWVKGYIASSGDVGVLMVVGRNGGGTLRHLLWVPIHQSSVPQLSKPLVSGKLLAYMIIQPKVTAQLTMHIQVFLVFWRHPA